MSLELLVWTHSKLTADGSEKPAFVICDISSPQRDTGLLALVHNLEQGRTTFSSASCLVDQGQHLQGIEIDLVEVSFGSCGMVITASEGELAGRTLLGIFPVLHSHASINYEHLFSPAC